MYYCDLLVTRNRSGSGSVTNKITIPAFIARDFKITNDNRKLYLSYDKDQKEIIIRKERKIELNEYFEGYREEYIVFYLYRSRGTLFKSQCFNDFYSACEFINRLVCDYYERNIPYFVDNDFYDNKFSNSADFYLCLKKRKVSAWEKYEKNSKLVKNNNIIYLNQNNF